MTLIQGKQDLVMQVYSKRLYCRRSSGELSCSDLVELVSSLRGSSSETVMLEPERLETHEVSKRMKNVRLQEEGIP